MNISQVIDRILILLMPTKYQPDYMYLRCAHIRSSTRTRYSCSPFQTPSVLLYEATVPSNTAIFSPSTHYYYVYYFDLNRLRTEGVNCIACCVRRHVGILRVHLFTAIQIAVFVIMWVIKEITITSLFFPVLVRSLLCHLLYRTLHCCTRVNSTSSALSLSPAARGASDRAKAHGVHVH